LNEEARIGVFVCRCGMNIAKSVDVKALTEFASKLPGVVYAEENQFTCSEAGQNSIKEAIKTRRLNRVVVASCSPKLHESTFRRTVSEAGLNPFLIEMANIREQCSWPHMHEPEQATEKAKHIVAGAVERSKYLEEIGEREEPVNPTALVVGAGIAGIESAIGLADCGFQVHLVEKRPFIGGKVAQLGKAFPTEDCGICVSPRAPSLDRRCLYKERIIHDPHIKLHTLSQVRALSGHIGSFKARIEKAPRFVREDLCIACGKCEEVCPVEVDNEFDLSMSRRRAIYLPFMQAIPHAYFLDAENCNRCGRCVEVCPTKAISLDETAKTLDLDVGTVIVAVGYDEFDPNGMYGYGNSKDVITQLKLARMMDASGPTCGRIVRPSDGRPPKRISMIQCVGSRDKETHLYCSKVCCMVALKHARSIRMTDPESEVTVIYKDIRPSGRGYEEYYTGCQELGVRFLHGDVREVLLNNGVLHLSVDLRSGEKEKLESDLVVLTCGLTPPKGLEELSRTLNLSLSPDGFLMEQHPKLAPIDTYIEGVYICGACQGPKDIPESVTQAMGAVARASIPMATGKVRIDLAKAIVDESLCIGCANCAELCPYNAIEMIRPGVARVIEVACKGCGVCVAECPARAIELRHYKDKQIFAAVEGILRGS
jgi:heterodisulfide reductase subunit A